MTSEGLREFGYKVREARIRKGWTLETLAEVALNNPDRKGYVSQIENGKRPLSALTIGNLSRVLDLPEAVTRPLLFAPAAEDEVTREDRLAETLIRRNDADPAPPQAEALVIALAYEFAGGKFLDLSTAYAALRNTLQADAERRAKLDRMQELDERLSAVLREVADLNDQDRREEAGEILDAAIRKNAANLDALQDAAVHQDRLRNRPKAAADRLIARLRAEARPEGLFIATANLLYETRERGETQGDPFDLALALELARVNHSRAKGPWLLAALTDLGNCHLALGDRQSGGGHLSRARNAYAEALRLTQRRLDKKNWAISQMNLGNALLALGERTSDPDLLRQAVAAHRAALTVRTPEASSMDWAISQNNLGTALRSLGKRYADPELLRQAVAAHHAALTVRTVEAMPMDWAKSQVNLGVALQSLGECTADPDLLQQAVVAHRAALIVHTPETTPMDWATSQNNLGLALRWLGAATLDAKLMDDAAAALAACLTERTLDAVPFQWAMTQWNLADLALARNALWPDPGLVAAARQHLALAREVFAEEGNDHQLAECDRLQALIDAA